MRILEINLARSWRGGERQTLYTAEALAAAGHELTVVTRTGSQLAMHCELKGIPVKEVSGGAALGWWLAGKGSGYDILHCQGSKELTWCILTKWSHRRPVVLSRRVNFVPKGAMTRWKYRKADAVVGVSEAIRETLQKFGIPKVKVIPSAFLPVEADQGRIKALKEKYNVGDRRIIATAAAFTREKDPETMFSAIEKLSRVRRDFVFLHFGDGPLKKTTEEAIRANGLENVYLLPGHVTNIEALYAGFDVFVMSSLEEGLGSSILDAFYQRVPVVSTAAGGIANLLADERGLLCNVRDASCLASNINSVLTSPGSFIAMTDRARAYLFAHHGLTTCSAQYETLFRSLHSTS